jgi:hypothetical protein
VAQTLKTNQMTVNDQDSEMNTGQESEINELEFESDLIDREGDFEENFDKIKNRKEKSRSSRTKSTFSRRSIKNSNNTEDKCDLINQFLFLNIL